MVGIPRSDPQGPSIVRCGLRLTIETEELNMEYTLQGSRSLTPIFPARQTGTIGPESPTDHLAIGSWATALGCHPPDPDRALPVARANQRPLADACPLAGTI